ncbi:MAG TPA: hypothetical protein VFI15_04780 [Candidatus Limnocylindrales bacterium]|nr:hypothetical protein [Candidatus Limnocylindrales bacterium]
MPLTQAEVQRAYRARKKAEADPVRVFLGAVITEADAAREKGEASPTGQRLAAIAAETLALIHEMPDGQRRLADIARQCGIPGAFIRDPSDLRHQHAARTLDWANSERIAGRATPAVIREGLRAARLIVASERQGLNDDAIGVYIATLLVAEPLAPPHLRGEDWNESEEDWNEGEEDWNDRAGGVTHAALGAP